MKQRIADLEAATAAYQDATRILNRRIAALERATTAHDDATRALNRRLKDLEAPIATAGDATGTARQGQTRRHEEPSSPTVPAVADNDATSPLTRRVEQLEKAQIAHEDATRTIIRQSFAERASSINDYVDFGGSLEVLLSRTKDFNGAHEDSIILDTADLDFDIKANDWVTGSLALEFQQSTPLRFRPTDGGELSIDRITPREALITLGNTRLFPLFGKAGRADVPFGTATGNPVTESLTIVDPLTIEAFETREDFIMLGLAMPAPPPLAPLDTTRAPSLPPVEPVLLNPLVRKAAHWLCASLPCFPTLPKSPAPIVPSAPAPPFTAAVYAYRGATGENHIEEMGGMLGYLATGRLPRWSLPWSLDFGIDGITSVFDSRFLSEEYQPFLGQIGLVPGMAAHAKSHVGPVGLILEWNGALADATFTDDRGRAFSLRPSSRQIQLMYQFGYNPSVEDIGAQGTYVVAGYSETTDLAGVRHLINGRPTRVGFLPEKRLSVGLGEWVMPAFRVAVEYSHDMDYPRAEGGTGNWAGGVLLQLTYEW